MPSDRAIESGWQEETSFSVPPGHLLDGLTYHWHVWTSDGQLADSWTAPDWTASFSVELQLGARPAAPYDRLGPASVNLASGNLVVGMSSPAGVSYAYNSATPLVTGAAVGSYYNDLNGDDVINDPVVMRRRDPSIGFAWGLGGPGGGVWADDFLVRWQAQLSVPAAGEYRFFAIHRHGMRIWVDDHQLYDSWGEVTNLAGSHSEALTATAGQALDLRVEYMAGVGDAYADVWVEGPVGEGGATVRAPLDPSWLAPASPALPVGWTLSAGLGYSSARVVDDHVILTDASGAAQVHSGFAGGYIPPPGSDDILALDAEGRLSLHAADGSTYAFGAEGQITSATAPTDDQASSAWTYHYATVGGVSRLVRITEPLSGRSMGLRYGGFEPTEDPGYVPDPDLEPTQDCQDPGAGFDPAPPPLALCRIDYWDPARVVKTHLRYEDGRLAQIEDPGATASPVTPAAAPAPVRRDFAYGAHGRLVATRSPLAHDALAAGVASDGGAGDTLTLIGYDEGARVASITLPVPNAGSTPAAPRPRHDYAYLDADSTEVAVAGISGRRVVDFDDRGRVASDTDPTGLATTLAWDEGDRLRSVTDPAARRRVTVYDGDAARAHPSGRPTEGFGPAPADSCFQGLEPSGACAATMGHSRTLYDGDEGGGQGSWRGLAATLWANRLLAGQPSGHDLVGLPLSLPGGSAWSGRFTGELIVADAGDYDFALSLTGGARLYLDDSLILDASGDRPVTEVLTGPHPRALGAGRHRIRLDYQPPSSGGAEVEIRWGPAGGPLAAMAQGEVAPRYSLPTRSVTHDQPAQAQRTSAAAYLAPLAAGLVSESVTDLGGVALSTTLAYDDAFLRPTARFAPGADPADAATGVGYSWWAPAASAQGACPGAAEVPQGGALAQITAPADAGGSRRAESFVYDWTGRVVEHSVAGASTCITYDGRGRPLRVAHPAHVNDDVSPPVTEAARVVSYDYALGGDPDLANDGNPLVSSVSDPAGTITTTVDLLGRVVSYVEVWGQASTYHYDQAGRMVRSQGPAGLRELTYDDAGRLQAFHLDDPLGLLATAEASYVDGELSGVAYANATTLAVGYDDAGRPAATTYRGPLGAPITSNTLSRSQGGRVVDESIDGTDAHPGANFVYDGAGRLTQAWVPAQALSYGYGDNGAGCALDPAVAGALGNRSLMTRNGASTTYCHDPASRLVSSSDPALGSPSYDERGNTTALGDQRLIYDGADRHAETRVAGGASVRYLRDATDRIVQRTEGSSVVRYGYTGPGDRSAFSLDAANQVLERSLALPREGGPLGGGLCTIRTQSGSVHDMSVPITTRLDEQAVEALDRAVAAGTAATRAGLVATAVGEWLHRHGEEAIAESYRRRYECTADAEVDLTARLGAFSAAARLDNDEP